MYVCLSKCLAPCCWLIRTHLPAGLIGTPLAEKSLPASSLIRMAEFLKLALKNILKAVPSVTDVGFDSNLVVKYLGGAEYTYHGNSTEWMDNPDCSWDQETDSFSC